MTPQYPSVTLPNTEVRLLESSIINDTFRLYVSLPFTYTDSDRTYPVIYLIDGDGLFHNPDTFNRYVIGSPAIHHDNRITFEYESVYAARYDDLPARVFMSVGDREEGDDPLLEPVFQFVTNMRTLAKNLRERNYPGLRLTTHVFEDESHGSVVPATFSRGLRLVFE